MATPTELGAQITSMALDAGFAAAGVCRAEPTRWADEMRAWLDAGRHGEMGYLEDDLEVRLDPAALLDGGRSVLMVADLYATRGDVERPEPGVGRIARYARGRDYHRVIKKRLHAMADRLRVLFPGSEFRSFVDTAPIVERELASRCGIGWVGKHTLVINPRLGSWMLLGGFVTTLELEPSVSQATVTDHCGSCTRCIEACPTDAIRPYSVDGSRCISYLTIEHRSAIDPAFYQPIGDWLVGCDICQEVCPHNSERNGDVGTRHEAYGSKRSGFDLLELLEWDERERRNAFATSPMKRVNLAMIKRNAVIVAGNHLALPGLRERIEAIAADDVEDEVVRETARAVLSDA
ncbi:MAG: tRNA epoxyqueuosine(34) reductase QueG [Planctomycetota bacterium]